MTEDEDTDRQAIIRHINERLAKSTLDSPQIAITREGWALIVQTLEAVPLLTESVKQLEAALKTWLKSSADSESPGPSATSSR